MATERKKLPKKFPKGRRMLTNEKNRKYEKQTVRTAANKKSQAAARARKSAARAARKAR